jgi:hypothetical protein
VEVGAEVTQPSCGSFVYGQARPFAVQPSPVVIGTQRDPLDAVPGPEPAVPSEDDASF